MLTFAGQPLYRHMMALLEQAGVATVRLSGSQLPGGLADRIPGRGPLSGVHAALGELTQEAYQGLLVVPVDMPRLSAGLIRQLCRQGVQHEQPLCYQGYILPLFLPITPQLCQRVNQAISSLQPRDYSLHRLHHGLKGGTMPLPEGLAPLLANANTPAEWTACQAELIY